MPHVISNQYTHRFATVEDAAAIAPLMAAFAHERMLADPTMVIKPGYDFESYIQHQLRKPFSRCWVLEHSPEEQPITLVGFILVYIYDETPPASLPTDLWQLHELETPFLPRRVGSVLGLYVQPEHRQPETIKPLAEVAMLWAEAMKVSDLDLLIGADQAGVQALLLRLGFAKTAAQYTCHFAIPTDAELPNLHPPHPELELPAASIPGAIPLRNPKTNELVRNPLGETVFLCPLVDENGDRLITSDGSPIYPLPVRDPQKDDWAFDASGQLVTCPILRDAKGEIVEHNGIPQFCSPAYSISAGKVHLVQNIDGTYLFCDAERRVDGEIIRAPSGLPVFKLGGG